MLQWAGYLVCRYPGWTSHYNTGRIDLYQELRELQTGHTSDENIALLEQMEADVHAGKSGTMLFEDIGAKGVMIRYESLDYSGWYIITIIPANIISMETESLSNYNLFLTAIVIFLLFISMLGLTISHQKNQKKLSQLAFCDELTGGMNDTSFRMTAQRYMKEQEGQYVLVSMDIQDFKMINQVYGNAGRKPDTSVCLSNAPLSAAER